MELHATRSTSKEEKTNIIKQNKTKQNKSKLSKSKHNLTTRKKANGRNVRY
jgi:hypothetical protein